MWLLSAGNKPELSQIQPRLEGKSALPTVWVPTEEVACYAPKLVGNKKNWEKMTPFALEEQLAQPIEKDHFSFGKPGRDFIPVIVVDQKKMQKWVDAVSSMEINANIFTPDFYALPYTHNRIALWVEKGRCLVRNGTDSGYAGSVSWITTLIRLAALKPEDMDIYADNIPSLPEKWRIAARPLPQPLNERLAHTAVDRINLLQRSFTLKPAKHSGKRGWYAAAALAAFGLAAHIFLLIADTRQLKEATQRVLAQTDVLFQETLKNNASAVNLKEQVNQYVKRIKDYQQQGGKKFWSIIRKLDTALSTCQSCRIESLDIRRGQLDFLISSAEGFDKQRAAWSKLKNVTVTEKELQSVQLPSGEKRQQLSVSIADRDSTG